MLDVTLVPPWAGLRLKAALTTAVAAIIAALLVAVPASMIWWGVGSRPAPPSGSGSASAALGSFSSGAVGFVPGVPADSTVTINQWVALVVYLAVVVLWLPALFRPNRRSAYSLITGTRYGIPPGFVKRKGPKQPVTPVPD
jgi:hypothetical protein